MVTEIIGNNLNNTIRGTTNRDVIKGRRGADKLSGQERSDTLAGHKGNDTLWGNTGNDFIYGGSGADRIFGGLGADNINPNKADPQDRITQEPNPQINPTQPVASFNAFPKSARASNTLQSSIDNSISFTIDLVNSKIIEDIEFPFIEYFVEPIDSNKDGFLETVLKINLNDITTSNPYDIVEFEIEYDDVAAIGSTVNIGDSVTNNGSGEDSNTQSNDSEIVIIDGNLTVYPNDVGGSSILVNETDFVDRNNTINLEVGNEFFGWNNNNEISDTLISESLYALNRQPDTQGKINNDIYAAFNRVIGDNNSIGSGVKSVTITLKDEEPTELDIFDPESDDPEKIRLNFPSSTGDNKPLEFDILEGGGGEDIFNLIKESYSLIPDLNPQDNTVRLYGDRSEFTIATDETSSYIFQEESLIGGLLDLKIENLDGIEFSLNVANDDSIETIANTQVSIDVLNNDGNTDLYTIDFVEPPENGTAVIDGDRILYTPDGDENSSFIGEDSFIYGISDLNGRFDIATITVEVDDSNLLIGTSNNDILSGREINDLISGREGNDLLLGGLGNDTLSGNEDNDTLRGQNGKDILYGGDGLDILSGGSANDSLFGDNGDDLLSGLNGDDNLNGGQGNDRLFGGVGNDTLGGKNGNDRLHGGEDNDKLWGGSGNDTLTGDNGDDLLSGLNGDDNLNGGQGNDRLFGGVGNDTLTGGVGNDTLVGGVGNDTLSGGGGRDRFSYLPGNYGNGEIDTITDFTKGQDSIKIFKAFGANVQYNNAIGELSVDGNIIARINGNPDLDVIQRGGSFDIF